MKRTLILMFAGALALAPGFAQEKMPDQKDMKDMKDMKKSKKGKKPKMDKKDDGKKMEKM